MKNLALLIIAASLLTGCQSAMHAGAGSVWAVTKNQDQFTDVETKMVTVGEGLSDSFIFTRSLNYYPFVGTQDGELFVGIRSGGSYRIPTGTVQIRIDANKTWTISPDETPIYLAPTTLPTTTPTDLDEKTATNVAMIQAEAMKNMTKAMSPYTAATGEKAKNILREMVAGKTIKYRTVGMNQAASSTGEVHINDSFLESLKAIGIDPENI
ncbi:hypothetical protein [Paenalcaligenes suwonensis]|uniref:hypothetical protein n=1 Tax=Paenalcaligenes suwonensis TaxID=1202713 RepID=UPI00140DBEF1|nr:hypothetical protein [Paenalcaligenes suwonensis]NHC62582.1 hypothetical protein [Paenalcaligenes suwonensis]